MPMKEKMGTKRMLVIAKVDHGNWGHGWSG